MPQPRKASKSNIDRTVDTPRDTTYESPTHTMQTGSTTMDLSMLPNQSVPLTQDGINELLAKLNAIPSLGQHVLNGLKENPRRVLFRLFDLTSTQKSIIQNMSEVDLQRYVGEVLKVKFGSPTPPHAEFDPDPIFAGERALADNLDVKPMFKCECHIVIGN
jgi:hypothetical protein